MQRGAALKAQGGAPAAGRLDEDAPDWARWALAAILAALALRWAVLALELAPLHFDEAQYWSYGEALDFGYYSKPPLAAWLIRASTEVFGDTVFGVRFFAPALHGGVAWLLFATGRRLFDARTGFWAALLYLTLPGVTVSSGLMTTDPPMMLAWAAALYALARALKAEAAAPPDGGGAPTGSALSWWALLGVAVGVGLLAKYTMIAFVGGGLGYALFSRAGGRGARRPIDWRGPAVAALAALAAFSPNLYWNAVNDFASIAHVGDNAKLSEGASLRPDNALEFFGAQAAIFGPVAFAALLLMAGARGWRDEWAYRLLMWLTLPLVVAMTVQAFLSRAHPNWAAPAYIAGSLAVAAWLLDRERRLWLRAAVGASVALGVGFYALAGLYAHDRLALPRTPDPFKKMRPNPPICAKAAAARGSARLLSTDRRLLADCLFAGGLDLSEIAIWNADGTVGNHYELTSSLATDDPGPFLLVMLKPVDALDALLERFERVEILETGRLRTHSDRETPYTIARLDGFRGYEAPPRP